MGGEDEKQFSSWFSEPMFRGAQKKRRKNWKIKLYNAPPKSNKLVGFSFGKGTIRKFDETKEERKEGRKEGRLWYREFDFPTDKFGMAWHRIDSPHNIYLFRIQELRISFPWQLHVLSLSRALAFSRSLPLQQVLDDSVQAHDAADWVTIVNEPSAAAEFLVSSLNTLIW